VAHYAQTHFARILAKQTMSDPALALLQTFNILDQQMNTNEGRRALKMIRDVLMAEGRDEKITNKNWSGGSTANICLVTE
jgi:hypothetical protein